MFVRMTDDYYSDMHALILFDLDSQKFLYSDNGVPCYVPEVATSSVYRCKISSVDWARFDLWCSRLGFLAADADSFSPFFRTKDFCTLGRQFLGAAIGLHKHFCLVGREGFVSSGWSFGAVSNIRDCKLKLLYTHDYMKHYWKITKWFFEDRPPSVPCTSPVLFPCIG